jgi:hypothetical protein
MSTRHYETYPPIEGRVSRTSDRRMSCDGVCNGSSRQLFWARDHYGEWVEVCSEDCRKAVKRDPSRPGWEFE